MSQLPYGPVHGQPVGEISRRGFMRRMIGWGVGLLSLEFLGGTFAFLWPNLKGGFGSVITAGTIEDVRNFITTNNQPFYFGAGRFYIVSYTGDGDKPGGPYFGLGVIEQGLMPLYQKCVHLGCRVPFCQSSQWFECPCHGSKYNKAGEYRFGPAPTGLNRFKIIIEGTTIKVDTSNIIPGPPRGTDTIHQAPEGPLCV